MSQFKELFIHIDKIEAALTYIHDESHNGEDIVDAWGLMDMPTKLEICNMMRKDLDMPTVDENIFVGGIDHELTLACMDMPKAKLYSYQEIIRKMIGLPLRYTDESLFESDIEA